MIPSEVNERDLWQALKPFYDLIGVTPNHVYTHPTVERVEDGTLRVRFSHVMEPGVEMQWPEGRTGDGEFDEKTYEVDIAVRFDASDPIRDIWPTSRPDSTPIDGGAA
jgi:hypothetical protein